MSKHLFYYCDGPQIRKLAETTGDRFQNLTHANLWDLVTILSAELAMADPKEYGTGGGLVRMDETREMLGLSWDAVLIQCLDILDGISRHEAKALLMGITAIVLESQTH